jgi:hypothetical protein
MKEISGIAMDWVTYFGGMDVVWVFLVALATVQAGNITGLRARCLACQRLIGYVGGTASGAVLIGGTKGVLVGCACGAIAAAVFAGAAIWLCRADAPQWQKTMGKSLGGKAC